MRLDEAPAVYETIRSNAKKVRQSQAGSASCSEKCG